MIMCVCVCEKERVVVGFTTVRRRSCFGHGVLVMKFAGNRHLAVAG